MSPLQATERTPAGEEGTDAGPSRPRPSSVFAERGPLATDPLAIPLPLLSPDNDGRGSKGKGTGKGKGKGKEERRPRNPVGRPRGPGSARIVVRSEEELAGLDFGAIDDRATSEQYYPFGIILCCFRG
jgi:hypothetical protein